MGPRGLAAKLAAAGLVDFRYDMTAAHQPFAPFWRKHRHQFVDPPVPPMEQPLNGCLHVHVHEIFRVHARPRHFPVMTVRTHMESTVAKGLIRSSGHDRPSSGGNCTRTRINKGKVGLCCH